MTNIIDINRGRPYDPYEQDADEHVEGTAECLGCGHHWDAHIDIPLPIAFRCPHCDHLKGVFMEALSPPESEGIFMCGCGNNRFLVLKTGAFCGSCGKTHTWGDL